MKTVFILRHAKSDWGELGQRDFDRPLAKRGLKDATRTGEILKQLQTVPELIISSPAMRAKQTATIVAEACEYDEQQIQWESIFYGASSRDLITTLRRIPETVQQAMIVGHNPTMEETVSSLLFGENSTTSMNNAIKMPTAGLVCLDVDVRKWSLLTPGYAIIRWFLIPKLVKAIQ